MLLFTSLLLFRPLSVRYSKLDLMFLFTVNECTGDMDTNFTVKKNPKNQKTEMDAYIEKDRSQQAVF